MKLIAKSNLDVDKTKLTIELKFKTTKMFDFAQAGTLVLFGDEYQAITTNSEELELTYEIGDYLDHVSAVHNHAKIKNNGTEYPLNDEYSLEKQTGYLITKVLDGSNYVGLRSSIKGTGIILSVVPFYEGGEDEKLEYFNQNIDKEFEKKYILFFEKRSETYGESSYQVFTKYNEINENCRFILSETNPDYDELKAKFGDKVVKKGSIEFYQILFQTKLLVSSELPANLISGKSIDMQVNAYINTIPFIFLQHGIMFGKPVISKNASMFWRKNINYNFKKMVVSSEAEKEQLYQVGYTPDELILTGLATLDQVDTTAKKKYCAYMPTYRAWEDAQIFNNRIEETTYYEDTLSVINNFKELGKLDDLVIVPHPGYDGHIDYENVFPEVKFDSYTNIRDEIKLYITDFSSAAFDAQFRGAAIIYYWNRREELERHYGAPAPLNGLNTNGIPIKNDEEFNQQLVKLYNNNFKMDQFYIDNFKEKMTFSDYKNSERIIAHIEAYLNESDELSNIEQVTIEGITVDIDTKQFAGVPKINNFTENIKNYSDLKIERLLKSEISGNELVITMAPPKGSDTYVLFENTIDSQQSKIMKVKVVNGKISVDIDYINKLEGYYRIMVIAVPLYGSLKKYVVKSEIDNRNGKEINIKPFKAVSRTVPYTNYKFINDDTKNSFVRLYNHNNQHQDIVVKPDSTLKVCISAVNYSHMIIGKGVYKYAEVEMLGKE